MLAGSTPAAMLAELERERRAIARARRRRAALDRRRRRRPLPRRARRRAARRAARGVRRPTSTDALTKLVARYARTHGPFTTARAARALRASTRSRGAARARARRRARPRRAAPRRHRARVVRPRGPAPPAPRVAGRAAQGDRGRRPARAGRVPAVVAGRRPPSGRGGAGVDRLREVLVPLQGLALPADVWERDVLPRRAGAYSPTWLDQLCASRRGRVGRRRRARAQLGPRRALLPRGRRGASARRRARRDRAAGRARARRSLRERLAQAPCFFTDLLAELPLAPEEVQEALWDLVWAGEVTNDAWAPLRAPRLTLARAPARAADRAPRRRPHALRHARARRAARRSRAAGR